MAVRPRFSAEVQLPLTATLKFEAQALAGTIRRSLKRRSAGACGSEHCELRRANRDAHGRTVGKTQLVVRGPGAGLAVTWNISVIRGLSEVRPAPRRCRPEPAPYPPAELRRRPGHDHRAGDEPHLGTDNPQVATVGEDGTVSGVGYGHARITATAPGGKTATADVYIVARS